jgi:hypothetical protein
MRWARFSEEQTSLAIEVDVCSAHQAGLEPIESPFLEEAEHRPARWAWLLAKSLGICPHVGSYLISHLTESV